MEEWKSVPSYEGLYEVSNTGKVKSLARWKQNDPNRTPYWIPERLIYQHKAPHGYMMVCLSKNGDTRTFSVHRLMLRAFLGEPPHKHEACHANGIRDDNRLENLRWDTRVNNFKDREKHGNTPRGERNGCSKLDDEKVRAILADSRSNRQIAKSYGITGVTVDRIKRRESWAHVESDNIIPTDKLRRDGPKGERNASAKLNEEKVRQILMDTRSNSDIARDYGITRTAVFYIKTRKNWRYVNVT